MLSKTAYVDCGRELDFRDIVRVDKPVVLIIFAVTVVVDGDANDVDGDDTDDDVSDTLGMACDNICAIVVSVLSDI